ncbi:hypothetical protein DSO57_1028408 [Entomophthora muscae]|uniref:Uncharacterized protein n=1 Tax=Entomophthora muscae TaxID=34485 RepID=A0ACC2UBT1_9FUNG|nr:hypothetical protein DSO57_1028408 [Entomophthora muscae]
MPKIYCIAIIGKQNNPLYIKNFEPGLYDDLKFHYIAHTSCDLFYERAANGKSQGQYHGLLHVVEDFVVYGYMTNTSVKFIVVLKLNDEIIKDMDMKMIFRNIHSAYVMYVCNPFHNASLRSQDNQAVSISGPEIKSRFFESFINKIGSFSA